MIVYKSMVHWPKCSFTSETMMLIVNPRAIAKRMTAMVKKLIARLVKKSEILLCLFACMWLPFFLKSLAYRYNIIINNWYYLDHADQVTHSSIWLTFFAWLMAGMRHMSRNHSPLQQEIARNTVGSTTMYLKCFFWDTFQAAPTAAEESRFS